MAASGAIAQAPSAPRHGGTLRFLDAQESAVLVPLTVTGSALRIGPKITEGLLTYAENMTPLPRLATSWSISASGLEYTFKLRRGVLWHDGKPFTSKDVAYSIKTLKEFNSQGRATFGAVTEVRTPDPYTAVLVLSKPAPYLLRALDASESPIVASHIYEGTDPRTNPNNLAPIGTGPFKFKEWVRGSHVVLERNAQYWDKPKPYLDQVIIRFVPDLAARTVGFETGEIDLGGQSPALVPLNDVARLKDNPQLAFETKGFGYRPGQNELFFNYDNPIFQKKEVRSAIAHAIDIQSMIKVVWYGFAKPSPTPISPLLARFHDAGIKPYAFDVAKANALLDQAGYPRKADGSRFTLRLFYNPFHERRVADFIRQSLSRVGINAEISAFDLATYVKRTYTDRDWDLTLEVLANGSDPAIGVQRIYWTNSFKVGLPFSNPSHYSNPAVDLLLEKAAVEIDDAKRAELYKQFQRIVYDEVAAVNLVTLEGLTIANKRVKGYNATGLGMSEDFSSIYLDTK